MKPPVCAVCGADYTLAPGPPERWVSLVAFANAQPMAPGVGGHPIGVEWFCRDHAEAAQRLCTVSSSEALNELRRRDGVKVEGAPDRESVGLVLEPREAGEAKFVLLLRKLFSLPLPVARKLAQASPVFAEIELGWDVDAMVVEAKSNGVEVSIGKAPTGAVRVPILSET